MLGRSSSVEMGIVDTSEAEMDLRWFFGSMRGSPVLEKSVIGDMLDRAEWYGHNEQGARIESTYEQQDRAWEYQQRQCSRPLEVLSEDDYLVMRSAWEDLGLEEDPGLDVSINPSHVVAVRDRESVYVRFAMVSRGVARCSRVQAKVLEDYFGVTGNRWVRHTLGRLIVVYQHTEAGGAILRERRRRCAAGKEPDVGGPAERIAAEWKHQRKWRDETRAIRFRHAEDEARLLLTDSKFTYIGAQHGTKNGAPPHDHV